jgi:hypothetical protein
MPVLSPSTSSGQALSKGRRTAAGGLLGFLRVVITLLLTAHQKIDLNRILDYAKRHWSNGDLL